MGLAGLLLLLLGCEGVLSQSRAASVYDDDVYTATTSECPETPTQTPATSVGLTQLTSTTAKAGSVAGSVKGIYLVNQYGTILDYQTANVGSGATFDWSRARWGETHPYPDIPTEMQARVVYTDCQTSPDHAMTPTWAGLVTEAVLSNDVGANAENDIKAHATPTISIDQLAANWFSTGGTFKPSWTGGGDSLLAWAETDGAVQWAGAAPSADPTINFGAGTLSVTACELFKTVKLCTTTDLAPEYVTALESGASTTVAYAAVFSAGKSGNVHTLKPCSTSNTLTPDCTLTDPCDTWFIYAKKDGQLMASGFTSTLEWNKELTEYTAYLSCEGGALKQATISTTNLPVTALSVLPDEVLVDYPDCNVDGSDAPAGTSFLLDDGRNCTCVMGDALCKAKHTRSIFRLSDGEAVGIALCVSIIVMIILMAAIFFCLKKTAQKQERVMVLTSKTAGGDPVPQDDHL